MTSNWYQFNLIYKSLFFIQKNYKIKKGVFFVECFKYEKDGQIGYITLQNEDEFFALSSKAIKEFDELLKEIGEKRDVKVVVIQGGNEKVLSPGHNLKEVNECSITDVGKLFHNCKYFMRKIREIPQIVITKVRGAAVAAGCQLVAISDMAVASEDARFATPGINSGLFCSTPAVFLSRNIGRKKAAELLFTGGFMSADEALDNGLVNKVVPVENLDEETEKLAQEVTKQSLNIIEIGKRAFYQQLNMADFQALDYATEVIINNTEHPDAKEGISCFLEKRKPKWND